MRYYISKRLKDFVMVASTLRSAWKHKPELPLPRLKPADITAKAAALKEEKEPKGPGKRQGGWPKGKGRRGGKDYEWITSRINLKQRRQKLICFRMCCGVKNSLQNTGSVFSTASSY